ncbi:MAG: Ldh family oxidoreductase [Solirubrobacterales bacterium]|nr:Ldh family oxidoreductase [Solirubrobacterales bacterium]
MHETELVRIDAAELRGLIVGVLRGLGASLEEAADQADLLVEADLRGRPSHGVQRLPVIVRRIQAALIRPGATYSADWRTDSVLVVDGGFGFGPHVARRALAAAAGRTARTGVAVVAIRQASHLGMLAPYLEGLAPRGLAGIAFTTSEALVHPWGGRVALVGTNPVAIALPTDEEPFVMDMATGAISKGEVIARGLRGQELPPGSAVEADGVPTVDPVAAADGAISPFGGPKGYALGLGIELLVAALTGTALGERVRGTLDVTDPVTKGDLFMVFDPAAIGGLPVAERLGEYLRELRRSPPAAGLSGVAIPGDRMRAERRRRLAEGIILPVGLWAELEELRTGARA